jgi:hypothetical protein
MLRQVPVTVSLSGGQQAADNHDNGFGVGRCEVHHNEIDEASRTGITVSHVWGLSCLVLSCLVMTFLLS